MEIAYSSTAQQDIAFWKRTGDRKAMERISSLIQSIETDPYTGIGKPEALKYELAGLWSRRITQEHRIVYRVVDDSKIEIVSLRFHY